MSNEIINKTEPVVNDQTHSITLGNNELTEASTTNGLGYSNGNNQIEQQQTNDVESVKNSYDDNEQQMYHKNDLEPEALRKVFIGGLSYKTEDQNFKDYFSNYGDIVVSSREK
jgi:RNA recognition motif-containing protein